MLEPLSPLLAITGGLLIGSAAALLLLLTGRVAGVSGMLASASGLAEGGPPWVHAVAFIVGLPVGTLAVTRYGLMLNAAITSSLPLLITAGLLVGFGTRLGNGCTSGHGVCGIARLSMRSFIATGVFMTSGVATAVVMRHVAGV